MNRRKLCDTHGFSDFFTLKFILVEKVYGLSNESTEPRYDSNTVFSQISMCIIEIATGRG